MSVGCMLCRTYSMKQAQNDYISFLHKTEGWTAKSTQHIQLAIEP